MRLIPSCLCLGAILSLLPATSARDLELVLRDFAAYEEGQAKAPLHEARRTALRGTRDQARRSQHESLLLEFVQSDATTAARRHAVLWLSDLATAASVPVLQSLAAQKDFADVARIALAAVNPPTDEPTRTITSGAAFTAELAGSAEPERLLIAALSGNDPAKARLAFAQFVEGVAEKPVTSWLVEHAAALDEELQLMAMNALLRLGVPEAATLVARLSKDGRGTVQVAAIRHLGTTATMTDLPRLDALLSGPDEALAEAAGDALVQLPEPVVRDHLMQQLEQAEPDVQQRALTIIAARPESFASEALLGISRKPSNPNREAAIRALGRAGAPRTFPAALKGFVDATSTNDPQAPAWRAALWDLARRQADPSTTARQLQQAAESSTGETTRALSAMAHRLDSLLPPDTADDFRSPEARRASNSR